MSAAADPLQAALYVRLSSTPAMVPVLDAVRTGRPKPYVTIGDDVVTPGPTVDVESEEIVTTLHVWSDQAGLSEAKVIMGQIKDALHNRPLTVAGFRPVRLLFLHSRAFTQPDGMIRHGVIQFQARIERL
ncbi:DUF3168 domain-containing protein [Azospirillum thiophilum]|uniref:DUF3168 domain-containing protein n=1 Tax=Azospirillum thiophilum TaxID=528244 RepID=UPI000696B6AF|nr:DUF3168 domain-containing protein [Azospirillum thiophilum]